MQKKNKSKLLRLDLIPNHLWVSKYKKLSEKYDSREMQNYLELSSEELFHLCSLELTKH